MNVEAKAESGKSRARGRGGSLSFSLSLESDSLTLSPHVLLSKAQPLPQNDFHLGTAQHAVYDSCLAIELLNDQWTTTVLVDEMNKPSPEDFVTKMPPRVVGRALGCFLRHAPYAEGLDCLIREINDCNNDQESMAGAYIFMDSLARVGKRFISS